MPMKKAVELCPDATVLPVNMKRYKEMSGRVFEIFERYTPDIEPVSIDEALSTSSNFEIDYGKYQLNSWKCNRCHSFIDVPNEKMTDVNIAVELLTDAFQNKFDIALVVFAQKES